MELTHFKAALTDLGESDIARGHILNKDDRTIRIWRKRPPLLLRTIATNLELARALLRDAEQYAESNKPSA